MRPPFVQPNGPSPRSPFPLRSLWACLVALALQACGGAPSGPLFLVEGGNHVDFGDLAIDQQLPKKVWLANPSRETVSIKKVELSCGCTSYSLPETEIAPGNRVPLELTLAATPPAGAIKTNVRLSYQVGNSSEVHEEIHLTARVIDFALFSEAKVDFGSFNLGKTTDIGRDLVVTKPDSPFIWDDLKVEGPPYLIPSITREKDRTWKIHLALASQHLPSPGPLKDTLLVRCLNQSQAAYSRSLHISGYVEGSLKAEPASLFFGLVSPGSNGPKKLTVRSNTPGLDLRRLKTLELDPQLELKTVSNTGSLCELEFILRPSAEKAGNISGIIHLAAGPHSAQQLRIPFVAYSK